MVVVPAGEFMMGSPEREPDRNASEGPQHKVTIAKPFAVGKFEVTFEEWDACVPRPVTARTRPLGARSEPVINVSWDDHQRVCRLAVAADEQGLPAVDRGGMGVCGASRRQNPLLLGRST